MFADNVYTVNRIIFLTFYSTNAGDQAVNTLVFGQECSELQLSPTGVLFPFNILQLYNTRILKNI